MIEVENLTFSLSFYCTVELLVLNISHVRSCITGYVFVRRVCML